MRQLVCHYDRYRLCVFGRWTTRLILWHQDWWFSAKRAKNLPLSFGDNADITVKTIKTYDTHMWFEKISMRAFILDFYNELWLLCVRLSSLSNADFVVAIACDQHLLFNMMRYLWIQYKRFVVNFEEIYCYYHRYYHYDARTESSGFWPNGWHSM